MARLPTPGGDNGNWGAILNDYLAQIHNSDGTLKDNVITSAALAPNAVDTTAIADGSIQETKLANSVQIKLNAVAGTPDWNTLTNKPLVIAAGTDQATARAAIGAGTSSLVLAGTGSAVTAAKSDHTQTASTISDSTVIGRTILTAVDAAAVKTSLSLTKSDVGLGNVDNTSDATKNSAVVTLTNKTLDNTTIVTIKDANLTIQDDGDVTKQAKLQLSNITTGTTRTYTLPDASGTLALTSVLPPIRFSASTAVLGVTPTDYAYSPRTLVGAHMRVASAPVGSALSADVQHWDGFTWTTIGTLTIANGSATEAVISFSQAQVASNMIRLNVTSVGSSTAATGVAVDILVG